MNVLIWYKRDLRVEDHPALTLGAGSGAVLPLYIAEPDYWALPDASARQWEFLAETLAGLRRDLARLGAPLVVRVGGAVEVLSRLCKQNDISQIISLQEVGNEWTFARDKQVAAWARSAGIVWQELPGNGVRRGRRGRAGWDADRAAYAETPALPAPLGLRMVAGIEPGVIPSARALRLAADDCPHRQTGGRAQGLALLDSFLATRGQAYRRAMSAPLSAERACSRLSPYLAVGALSAREVEQAAAAQLAARPGADWAANLRSFQSRIAWRAHFTQKLEDAPRMERQALHKAAGDLPGRSSDGPLFDAWRMGQTGLPYLDACMRYLASTGWINFRARAMLTSVATYHLWLDWRAVGQHLARRFTDYDPGIHWPQIQMQAGMTGINRLRVYNPIKQGLEQDPTGAFTRRWVPELAHVPDGFLQMPWKWPGAQGILGRRYPEPVVDVTHAAREARARIGALRQTDRFAEEEALLIERHASPAQNPLFVNDRRPSLRRPRPAPLGQLCLDL
ncbi:deoxyribodipyrimidine photolyase [Pseudorhodobacter sp. E13]|uniref:FAD-binding domain-containing protein n=1 Tax=Pseudorhodobacter sp. E13 TaxID=2487931 RepID=UPI000F8F33F0|nr:FAD-binding domain-containing protein [Pseudorhodobacter sp. E13]RUS60024.1 deoxyribodipyrimidine photolyase [Pseudorhodobacter sp. E13]